MSLATFQTKTQAQKKEVSNTNLVKNGISASPYFNRKSYASIMDTNLVAKNVKEKTEAMGEGSYHIQMVDKRGNVIKGAPINLGGRMFMSNSAGTYNIVDVDFLKQQEIIAKQEQEYINTCVYLASSSIEALATTLGLEVAETIELCKSDGIKNSGIDPQKFVPDEVDKMNCHPEILKMLDDNSLQMALAVSKIRSLIKIYAPILDHDTGTDKAIKDETK